MTMLRQATLGMVWWYKEASNWGFKRIDVQDWMLYPLDKEAKLHMCTSKIQCDTQNKIFDNQSISLLVLDL